MVKMLSNGVLLHISSYPNIHNIQWYQIGNLKLAMVGEFAPQKLANTRNQGLIYYFVDCLEQRPVNYSSWAKSSPCL